MATVIGNAEAYLPKQLSAIAEQHPTLIVAAAAFGAFVLFWMATRMLSNHNDLTARSNLLAANRNVKNTDVKASNYSSLFASEDDAARRKKEYQDVVNHYYDLSTDFYEFGWGTSFHFAPRFHGEGFDESLRRHEYFLASRLGLKDGMRVLDCGCGVGGPARNIARFSRAHVTGISLNDYQINRGQEKTAKEGLSDIVELRQGNFMKLDFDNGSFDRVYAIEATCHAPERVGCYSEIYRVLKPGGYFGAYEWVMTDNYDPNNAEHRRIKYEIEVGDGLPDMTGPDDVHQALEKAGFEIEDFRDIAADPALSPLPWYQPFLSGIKTNRVAVKVTNAAVWLLELLRLAPKGSHVMHSHLAMAARSLRAGGEQELFTPMLFFLARKPLEATAASDSSDDDDTSSVGSVAESVKRRRRGAAPTSSASAKAKTTPARRGRSSSASRSTVTRRRRTTKA